MPVFQVIYSSQPFGYDAASLMGILIDSRRWNAQSGVTGALLCRADIYLQLLEGPKPEVEATMARIARDDRHLNLQTHSSGAQEERMFGSWAMLHDPADSWIWSQDEVADGALERATEDEVRTIFERLAAAHVDGTDAPP